MIQGKQFMHNLKLHLYVLRNDYPPWIANRPFPLPTPESTCGVYLLCGVSQFHSLIMKLKEMRSRKGIMGPINRNYWIKQKQTQQFFTLYLVLFAQTWCLKRHTKTQLWVLAFCAQQSVSMSACARKGNVWQKYQICHQQPFWRYSLQKSKQTWGPGELKFESNVCMYRYLFCVTIDGTP